MPFAQTIALGAIAGFTIFLGLPLGRVERLGRNARVFLSGLSGGILVFLLFDILGHATAPVEAALVAADWGQLAVLGAVYVTGFGLGMLSLFYVPRLRQRRAPAAEGTSSVAGGTSSAAEVDERTVRDDALGLGLTIATGIGLHNFSEGLAIGQSAGAGEISLAVLLIVGFGLHNATEGFGIVGPLVARDVRPSWTWLGIAGLIAGGPTFVGTIVGSVMDSPILFVAFLALAAGAILNVIGELVASGRKASWEMTLWGVFVGFVAGLATDLILVAAGG